MSDENKAVKKDKLNKIDKIDKLNNVNDANDDLCNSEQLETAPAPPEIVINEIEDEPPLCGRTQYGGRVEDTALSKSKENQLVAAKMQAMLKEAAPSALRVIFELMNDPKTKDDLKMRCATDIVDRVLGKAKQPIDGEINGGINIKLSADLEKYSG